MIVTCSTYPDVAVFVQFKIYFTLVKRDCNSLKNINYNISCQICSQIVHYKLLAKRLFSFYIPHTSKIIVSLCTLFLFYCSSLYFSLTANASRLFVKVTSKIQRLKKILTLIHIWSSISLAISCHLSPNNMEPPPPSPSQSIHPHLSLPPTPGGVEGKNHNIWLEYPILNLPFISLPVLRGVGMGVYEGEKILYREGGAGIMRCQLLPL